VNTQVVLCNLCSSTAIFHCDSSKGCERLGYIKAGLLVMRISRHEAVSSAMQRINRTWLDGNVEALVPMVDADIVMVFPGFTGRTQGREQFLAGFRDFCENARVHEFQNHDYATDVVGDTAVVTFRYDMIYERSGERCRASGRDLWVFRDQDGRWTAVWRAMLDMQEQAA
jgi:uncharacterized protein (TIGR02246 family)